MLAGKVIALEKAKTEKEAHGDRKTPITAADLLNDRVLPLFEEHDVKLLRVLTVRPRA